MTEKTKSCEERSEGHTVPPGDIWVTRVPWWAATVKLHLYGRVGESLKRSRVHTRSLPACPSIDKWAPTLDISEHTGSIIDGYDCECWWWNSHVFRLEDLGLAPKQTSQLIASAPWGPILTKGLTYWSEDAEHPE